MSNEILHDVSEEILGNIGQKINNYSVLVIDGWKNPHTNHQTVACILQNADGGTAFLDAFDFTQEELAETAQNMVVKIEKCCEVAKQKYKTDVYALVSENARNMVALGAKYSVFFFKSNLSELNFLCFLGNLTNIWHSTCSSHTANLLLKDMVNQRILKKVTDIFKQFRNTGPAHTLLLHGGAKLKLPIETRWCTYRDTYCSFIRNIQPIKKVIADGKFPKIITQETIKNVYDEEFINEIKKEIKKWILFAILSTNVNLSSMVYRIPAKRG